MFQYHGTRISVPLRFVLPTSGVRMPDLRASPIGKEIYGECYEAVVPRLAKGGLFVADNAVSHRGPLKSFLDRASADDRVDALVLPVGHGLLVCRKT